MKAKHAMKAMKTMKKRRSGAANRKRQIQAHTAECVTALVAGNQAVALHHMCVAQKKKAVQAKNYKRKRAQWYKGQTAGNTEKPKPRPNSPLPRIDPADDAAEAKARSQAKRILKNFVPPPDILAEI